MELEDWLLCDLWSREEAILLLNGINPARTSYTGKFTGHADVLFPGSIFCLDGTEIFIPPLFMVPPGLDELTTQRLASISDRYDEVKVERHTLARKVLRLHNLIKRSVLPPLASPKQYIEWAASKGIDVPKSLTRLSAVEGSEIAESPQDRRHRLRTRLNQEKAKGTKAYLKAVAEEEGLSISRLKQLTKKESSSQASWVGQLTTPKRQTGSNSKKTKI